MLEALNISGGAAGSKDTLTGNQSGTVQSVPVLCDTVLRRVGTVMRQTLGWQMSTSGLPQASRTVGHIKRVS